MGRPTADKNYSKLEWFFYIIFIPILFVSILTVTLLWFLDFDVKTNILKGLNKIPVVEKLIDDKQFNNPDDMTINNSKEQLQQQVIELKKSLDENSLTLTKTEQSVETKDKEIESLKQQIDDLNSKLKEKNISEKSREQEISDLAKIYETMSSSKAADVISKLTTEEAVLVLSQMKTDSQSTILGKMDPQKAAETSILLKDNKYSKDKDISALQKRIDTLVNEIDKLKSNKSEKIDYQQLAITFANMEPTMASDTLIAIANNNLTKAQNILIAMDPIARSKVLSEMRPNDAARFSESLVD